MRTNISSDKNAKKRKGENYHSFRWYSQNTYRGGGTLPFTLLLINWYIYLSNKYLFMVVSHILPETGDHKNKAHMDLSLRNLYSYYRNKKKDMRR